MAISKYLQFQITFWKTVYYLLWGVLSFLPFILFLITIQLPIYIYRVFLTKLVAPCFRPHIGKAVTISAQFQATDFNQRDKGLRYGSVTRFVLSGDMSIEELRGLTLQNWIRARKEARNGTMEFVYPEFQQYLGHWMGFMFWKQDPDFSLNNHLFEHQLDTNIGKEESENISDKFVENLLNKPFSKHRSPWQIHLIRNCKCTENKDSELSTVILLRSHHVLADGMSMFSVIETLFGVESERVQVAWPERKLTVGYIISEFAEYLQVPFRFLVGFGYCADMSWRRQYPWKSERSDGANYRTAHLKDRPKFIFLKFPLLPLEKLKFIKNAFGVSLSSVLLSGLSAAFAKSFVGLNVTPKDTVRTSIMLPTGGHRNKLRNVTVGTCFDLETSAHFSPEERLKVSQQQFVEAKKSFVSRLLFPINNIMSGSLAKSFARIPTSKGVIPVVTSNFPGPAVKVGMGDGRMMIGLDCIVAAFMDLTITMFSYDAEMRIDLAADASVFTRAQVKKIAESFCDEIEILFKLACDKNGDDII